MAKATTTGRVKINRRKVQNFFLEEVAKNMLVAAVFVRDAAKIKLNRGQPTRTRPGGSIVGLDPSKPGEPPKKVTGQLQASIASAVVVRAKEVQGLVGTNQKRAPALELGNRKGTLKARPFLRPALFDNRQVITEIVAKGIRVLG